MDIKVYEKPVITKFVMINGEEFELGMLIACLEQISDTIYDIYGNYSLRDYELIDYEITKKLVNMGVVKNFIGSRMADLYCIKDKEGIEELLDTLYEL